MVKNEEILLKAALAEGKVVIGTDETLKFLKQGKLKKIYLAANCPSELMADIHHYSKLANVIVVKLNRPNDELGTFCKKPYAITVLGVE